MLNYKKLNKTSLLFALCSCVMIAQAQQEETNDPKAKEILQALGKKTKTFKSIKAEFTITIYDKDKKANDAQKGSLISKGGKYKLDIKNQTVFCDSVTTWTFLKDANEVQISNVDPNADKASITPTNIFTVYDKIGFKNHFESETKQGTDFLELVDLYPKHPEREKYHTLKLTISKEKNQIMKIDVLLKDGTMQTYTVNSFLTNTDLPNSTFIFNAKDFPGVEVEDLRN